MAQTLDTIKVFDTAGTVVPLTQLWHERPTLLFLMRHLGCALCRRQLLSLRDEVAKFSAAECDIAVIVMGDGKMAHILRDLYKLPFNVYADSTLEVYEAFEFGETSLWNVMGPHILVRQFGQMLQGQKSSIAPQDSIRRLGGLVVMSPEGNLLYHYIANPIYRYPSWDDVLQTVSVAHTA